MATFCSFKTVNSSWLLLNQEVTLVCGITGSPSLPLLCNLGDITRVPKLLHHLWKEPSQLNKHCPVLINIAEYKSGLHHQKISFHSWIKELEGWIMIGKALYWSLLDTVPSPCSVHQFSGSVTEARHHSGESSYPHTFFSSIKYICFNMEKDQW